MHASDVARVWGLGLIPWETAMWPLDSSHMHANTTTTAILLNTLQYKQEGPWGTRLQGCKCKCKCK